MSIFNEKTVEFSQNTMVLSGQDRGINLNSAEKVRKNH